MREWLALTHAEAAAGWGEVPVLATYRHVASAEPARASEAGRSPAGAAQVWWHSALQFERWGGQTPGDCHHACGPGKTAEPCGVQACERLTVFPSVHHWREWLRS